MRCEVSDSEIDAIKMRFVVPIMNGITDKIGESNMDIISSAKRLRTMKNVWNRDCFAINSN